MADTILIMGNGFDIAMGRKTKYTDFIEFEKQLFSNPDEELLEFLKAKNISIEKYKDNLYLKFINENEETLGINWSNIELIISRLLDAIVYFKNNSDVLFESIYYFDTYKFDKVLLDRSNYIAKYYVVKVIVGNFGQIEFDNKEKELLIEELDKLFLNQLDLLIELLEIYLSYLDYIDFDIQKFEANSTALDAISDLSNSSVLNFNYTNTSGYLFGTSEEKTHFIHGRIDLDRTFNRINTMVFGIEDKENNVNSDLIPYQKYYQRVVKETGTKFEDFFKPVYEYLNVGIAKSFPKNIIIFGHSVDPLDKEIFQKCFKLVEIVSEQNRMFKYRFIFTYFNELAKRSIIKNLAIILGKEKLIELTGKQNVVFVKSDDMEGLKDALLP